MHERRRTTRARPTAATTAPAPAPAAHPLLALQRRAGNAAVNRMLQVGRADDAAEREADAVAAEVLGSTVAREAHGGDDPLGGTEVPAELSRRIAASSGQRLDAGTKATMEEGFGHDLSAVRVHRGPEAEDLSASLQAKAFTTGTDVFVGKGGGSDEVLAHELAHVVQGGGADPMVERWFVTVPEFSQRTKQGKKGKSSAQRQIIALLERYTKLEDEWARLPKDKITKAAPLIRKMQHLAEEWIKQNSVDGAIRSGREQRGAGMVWFAAKCESYFEWMKEEVSKGREEESKEDEGSEHEPERGREPEHEHEGTEEEREERKEHEPERGQEPEPGHEEESKEDEGDQEYQLGPPPDRAPPPVPVQEEETKEEEGHEEERSEEERQLDERIMNYRRPRPSVEEEQGEQESSEGPSADERKADHREQEADEVEDEGSALKKKVRRKAVTGGGRR